MKKTSIQVKIGLTALAVAALVFTSSCARKTAQAASETQAKAPETIAAPEQAPAEAVEQEIEETKEEVAAEPAPEPVPFPAQAIYFEFDNALLTAVGKEAVREKAEWLSAHPNVSVMVEGHCDSRGSEAYNQTLGEKRALAVKEALKELGIPEQRISWVSFGERIPARTQETKAAYEKNRRAEFKLQQPATEQVN